MVGLEGEAERSKPKEKKKHYACFLTEKKMKNQFEDPVYRLTGLQCPFVRDSVTEEDFFLPNNEYRIKVIEWLIEWFNFL